MRICVFGDSITWGACDYEKGGWATRLRNYLEKHNDVAVYNLGINGDTTEGLLRRFDAEAGERKPDIVAFAIGVNDSKYFGEKDKPNVPLDKFSVNIQRLAEKARKFTDKIVFVGITPVDEKRTMPTSWNPKKSYDNESIARYDAVVEDFCKKERLFYIPMKDVIQIEDLEDGLHPNSAGHEKMFRKILLEIEKI